jgi:DNA ligase (NAD+)
MEAYHAQLVKTISEIRGTSEKQSIEILRRCVQTIAIAKSIDPNKIKSLIFTEDFMESCVFADCSELSLEECRESCHCVEYHDGTCVPRYIKNVRTINRDPDKYAASLKTKELEALLELANYLYHNFEGGGLTDNAFDGLEFILNKRKKTIERRKMHVGALPVKKIRAKLPVPMPSLDKAYSGTKKFKNFLSNAPGKIYWSVKLDGISGLIVYKKGKVNRIFTRGDGTVGGDITYVKDYIKGIPKQLDDPEINIMVRGEFVVSREKFRSSYAELYSNARNFVNSQIASGKITSFLPDVEFVAYEVVKVNDMPNLPPPISRYGILELNKFKVVEHGLLSGSLMFDTLILYKEKRIDSPYDIDGLVLQYDVPLIVTEILENPKHAVAFKAILEEQIRDTRITDVEWRISRYGRYVPVAIYESVYIDGVRLHRATAHNAAHVRDWNMGEGTQIQIRRGGDVIPVIQNVTVDEDIDPIFPTDEYDWHWRSNDRGAEIDIELDEIDSNAEVQKARILHFFQTIQVKGIGPASVKKFYDDGLDTIKKVTRANIGRIQRIKGFGEKKSTTIYDNVRVSLRTTPLDRYLIAITGVPLRVGRKLIKQLLQVFPDLLEKEYTTEEIAKRMKKLKKEKKLPGFGPKRIKKISEEIPKLRKMLLDINGEDIQFAMQEMTNKRAELKAKGYNPRIEGRTFVLSGFMSNTPYELEDFIYDNMGSISSTVTSSTAVLIVQGLGTITQKMEKAHELGIPVMTVEEFKVFITK